MDYETLETMMNFEAEESAKEVGNKGEHTKVFFELYNHLSILGTHKEKYLSHRALNKQQYLSRDYEFLRMIENLKK